MDLTVFQLKFYTFFKIRYQTILQLTYCSLQDFFFATLKAAKVISIHIKNSKLEVSNYKHISLIHYWYSFWKTNPQHTFVVQKANSLLQTVWCQKRFINKPCHFKFARKHRESTRWQTTCTCQIFIELEKTFETVIHNILLGKLNHYGIRSIANDWCRCDLKDRTHFVCVNGFNKSVKYGVSQGF